jgi:hypothetical protein
MNETRMNQQTNTSEHQMYTPTVVKMKFTAGIPSSTPTLTSDLQQVYNKTINIPNSHTSCEIHAMGNDVKWM